MKTIIAGSRYFTDVKLVYRAVADSDFHITEVVSGCASGIDYLGEQYAIAMGVPIKKFPADWDTYGKSAGYIRNIAMGEYADALVAVWDGKSKGTKHMIDIATKLGLKIYVYAVN